MSGSPQPHASLPSSKKKLFLVVTLLLPIVLLGMLEAGLRIARYGPDLSLFITEDVQGTPFYTMNPAIKQRYFSQVDFTPTTSPEYFALHKKTGTYRIFCLGASTTVGYPYWYNSAFSTFLRERLHAQFPARELEIINLGITATNSYSVSDIARDVMKYEPDLLIVYDGHNEFYGALGVASKETLGSSRWITLLYLRVEHLRTFMFFRSLVNSAASLFSTPPPRESRGTMMERLARGQFIPYGSDQYRDGVEIFERNLDELRATVAERGVPLVLTTQVSNLRDHYPFISGAEPASSPGGGAAFRAEFDRGRALLAANDAAQAVRVFTKLLELDTLRADVHYSLGQCYERLHNNGAALNHYVKARDYDQLRFRASSDLNAAILRHNGEKNVVVVDMERSFKAQSPDSLIGNELIIEHLHPTSRGYFLMAKAYADAMRAAHLFASDEDWNTAPAVNEDSLWNERHMTVFDERLAKRKTEILTAAWPFTQATTPVVSYVPPEDTLGTIIENVTHARWDWKVGHQQAALYFEHRGDKLLAAREYEVIINQLPHDIQPYLSLAHLYLEMKDVERMRRVLRASLAVEKTILAYRALGDAALDGNNPGEAVAYYEGMAQFPQTVAERLQNGTLLAVAYIRSGHDEKAKSQLLLLLQMKPDYAPALELLAKLK